MLKRCQQWAKVLVLMSSRLFPCSPDAHLGSAQEEASEWLVVDRHQQVLYLAGQAEARWHLVAQWPRLHRQPLEYTQGELERLLDNLKEAVSPPDWPAKLAEALRESRANERLMLKWLDAQQEANEHDG